MAASCVANIAVGSEWTSFSHGFVFWEYPGKEHLPPEDEKGRREWLEGFLQAHADDPDEPFDPGGEECGERAAAARRRMLAGQCEGEGLLNVLDRMLAEWREAGEFRRMRRCSAAALALL